MKRLFLTTAAASLLTGAAWAGNYEMSDFDADGDAAVSRPELEDVASGVTDEIWSMYDLDDSEDLDEGEFDRVVFSNGEEESDESTGEEVAQKATDEVAAEDGEGGSDEMSASEETEGGDEATAETAEDNSEGASETEEASGEEMEGPSGEETTSGEGSEETGGSEGED